MLALNLAFARFLRFLLLFYGCIKKLLISRYYLILGLYIVSHIKIYVIGINDLL